jgi:LPXTG-motif cell wall-anchored protein
MLKRTMLAALAVTAALTLGAAAAGAQYPPPPNFCTVSDTTPTPGQSITLTCGTYVAGSTVTFTFFSAPVTLGSATADANGVVTATVTIPADATLGEHTITATGPAAAGGTLTNSVGITVVGAGQAGAGTFVPGTFTGALPRTGNDSSLPLARAGALLLAVGGVLVLAARRRRAESQNEPAAV